MTEGFFDRIKEKDTNLTNIELIPDQPEKMRKCEDEIKEKTTIFQDKMKDINKTRLEFMEVCGKLIREAEEGAEQKSISKIDSFRVSIKRVQIVVIGWLIVLGKERNGE
jgi:hypothetical protein